MEVAGAFEVGQQLARDTLRHQLNSIQLWQNRARDFSVSLSREEIARLEPVLDNVHTQQGRQMLRV
jgi:hypothetical protein